MSNELVELVLALIQRQAMKCLFLVFNLRSTKCRVFK